MSGKILIQIENPVTQSSAAVKALITFQTFGKEPAEMPPFYRLGPEMVLVQSNKKDVYYVCTPKTCSCPSATYHPGQPCKHQRKFFPGLQKSQAELEEEGESIQAAHNARTKRLVMPPRDEPLIERGGFKPVSLLPGEA